MRGRPSANRILVVDDEPNIVDVLAMSLRFQGFEVNAAGTGGEALAAVERFKPQLMVLDAAHGRGGARLERRPDRVAEAVSRASAPPPRGGWDDPGIPLRAGASPSRGTVARSAARTPP